MHQENVKDEPNWLSINQSNLKIEIENETVLFKALLTVACIKTGRLPTLKK